MTDSSGIGDLLEIECAYGNFKEFASKAKKKRVQVGSGVIRRKTTQSFVFQSLRRARECIKNRSIASSVQSLIDEKIDLVNVRD
jgi:hypothetical protein